jgi:hypothetical protein
VPQAEVMVESGLAELLLQRVCASVPDGSVRGVSFVQEPLDPRLNIPIC